MKNVGKSEQSMMQHAADAHPSAHLEKSSTTDCDTSRWLAAMPA
jgi:hypothetical protein